MQNLVDNAHYFHRETMVTTPNPTSPRRTRSMSKASSNEAVAGSTTQNPESTPSTATRRSRPPTSATTSGPRPPSGRRALTKSTKSTEKSKPAVSGKKRPPSGKSATAKNKSASTRGKSKNSRGHNRRTPTMEACAKIRSIIEKGDDGATFQFKGQRHVLAGYKEYPLPAEGHFGLPIEQSVSFHGRPTLPSDHPQHDYHVTEVAKARFPPVEMLIDGNVLQMSKDLRSTIKSVIDVEASKLASLTPELTALIRQTKEKVTSELKQPAKSGEEWKDAITALANNVTTAVASMGEGQVQMATTVASLGEGQVQLQAGQIQLQGTISSMAEQQVKLQEGQIKLQGAVSSLAEGQEALQAGQRDLQAKYATHDTEIDYLKARFDDLTSSCKRDYTDAAKARAKAREERMHNVEDTKKSLVFNDSDDESTTNNASFEEASPFRRNSPSPSPMRPVKEHELLEGTELPDLAAPYNDFLLEGFEQLLVRQQDGSWSVSPAVDQSLMTVSQLELLATFARDLQRGSLQSMASDFREADFMVLKRDTDVSALVRLESLEALQEQMEGSVLVVTNPANRYNTVYIAPPDIDQFIATDFLSSLSGAKTNISFVGEGGGDDVDLMIWARDSSDASATVAALLQLAAKGRTKSVDIALRSMALSEHCQKLSLPMPSDDLHLDRPIVLKLKECSLSDVGQIPNLVACFKEIHFEDCVIKEDEGSTAIADSFVNHLVSKEHGVGMIKFTVKGLKMSSRSMKMLVQGACSSDIAPKLVFGDTLDYGGMPNDVLKEICDEVTKALRSDTPLHDRLELETSDALHSEFNKALKQSLQIMQLKSVPETQAMNKLCDLGTLPICVSGLRSKRETVAEKVKSIWREIASASAANEQQGEGEEAAADAFSQTTPQKRRRLH